jgi:hypothetical protein
MDSYKSKFFDFYANSGYKSREVGEAFRLLEKAMLLELVYPVSSTQLPIIPETKRMPKLIWFDTGLVNYQAGIRKDKNQGQQGISYKKVAHQIRCVTFIFL